MTCLFLLFPDGRLPSAQWRLLVWLAGIGTVVVVGGFALEPGPPDEFAVVRNPSGLRW